MQPYYEEKGIVIYHADCREILPHLPKVDLVLTDPPYGVTRNEWDKIIDLQEWWRLIENIASAVIATSQQPFTTDLICSKRDWFKWSDVWHKTQAVGHLNAQIMPMREHEDILFFAKTKMPYFPQLQSKPAQNVRPVSRRSLSSNYGAFDVDSPRLVAVDKSFPRSVVRIANQQSAEHPTQKPLTLFKYLLGNHAKLSHLILDPFMGSGTTLRAAKDLGLQAIGIELEEKYCEIAANRLRQEVLSFAE